jgi:hypothetical protein
VLAIRSAIAFRRLVDPRRRHVPVGDRVARAQCDRGQRAHDPSPSTLAARDEISAQAARRSSRTTWPS